MKHCPLCNSPVRWIEMPQCETETTGRICLWECIRCSFYEEKVDRRRIKAKPCNDGLLAPPPEKAEEQPVTLKKKEDDVEDVVREGVESEHQHKPE